MTPPASPHPFAKGHGAENDFILLPDPHGLLDLGPGAVRRLCHRRTGIGADGILRAVHTTAVPEAAAMAADAVWFMDYRNPDGTEGQMCGNGIRLFARYLVGTGHAPPGPLVIATRAGLRRLDVPRRRTRFHGPVTVQMGRPRLPGPDHITVTAGTRTWPALHVDMGNPHAVALVDDLTHPGPLTTPPAVEPAGAYPHGTTVEFVVRRGPRHLALRVPRTRRGRNPLLRHRRLRRRRRSHPPHRPRTPAPGSSTPPADASPSTVHLDGTMALHRPRRNHHARHHHPPARRTGRPSAAGSGSPAPGHPAGPHPGVSGAAASRLPCR
ncbi:diaminopimelate epimerase [Streptomyces clavuligerus]|uniref:diaminopimelate epimerase n=1 Tax=Streptomyces clavuligerus TaxID=1901 RepID=UPI0030B8CE81